MRDPKYTAACERPPGASSLRDAARPYLEQRDALARISNSVTLLALRCAPGAASLARSPAAALPIATAQGAGPSATHPVTRSDKEIEE
jgi:hypothetical protein